MPAKAETVPEDPGCMIMYGVLPVIIGVLADSAGALFLSEGMFL